MHCRVRTEDDRATLAVRVTDGGGHRHDLRVPPALGLRGRRQLLRLLADVS
jgi:hypothetical protein